MPAAYVAGAVKLPVFVDEALLNEGRPQRHHVVEGKLPEVCLPDRPSVQYSWPVHVALAVCLLLC